MIQSAISSRRCGVGRASQMPAAEILIRKSAAPPPASTSHLRSQTPASAFIEDALESVEPCQVSPDDQLLDLGGAIGDRHDLCVSEKAFHGKFPGDAVAAMDLHGLAGDLDGHFRRIPFRH